ncbi:MAG: amidohydrolase family protein [Planctomycetota bacterium]
MFIDIHAHAYRRHPGPLRNGKQWFSTPEQVVARYDEAEIERGVLLPLVSPEVYLPQSNEEILQMVEDFPGRFIPFCNIDPRALTNSPDAPLGNLLRHYRDQGCKGIGEVMPNLPFSHPLVQNLFKHCEEVGFPLIFDISDRVGGDYGLVDDAGLPQLEGCLQKFPKLIILGHGPAYWAEIAKLRTPADRRGYPNYPVEEEGAVPRLFRKYENMWGDLSAGSGWNALARDRDHAVRFVNEFQNRLLFGTDICAPDQPFKIVDFLLGLRDEKKISEETFQRVARENAIKLLGL